jgi:hypothetical protein
MKNAENHFKPIKTYFQADATNWPETVENTSNTEGNRPTALQMGSLKIGFWEHASV